MSSLRRFRAYYSRLRTSHTLTREMGNWQIAGLSRIESALRAARVTWGRR